MNKRWLALLLALVMLLALPACGGDDPDEDQEQSEKTEQGEEKEESGDKEDKEDEENAEEPKQTSSWKPADDITIMVAAVPGSLSDITARVLAQYLERYIDRTVQVENVPGAYTEMNEAGEVTLQAGEGTAGWLALAGRAADGLTLGYIELPAFSNALFQWPDIIKEENYTPVCTHTTQTAVVIAREGETRFDSLAAMVGFGQQSETPLVAGTDGEHGQLHTWTQLFAKVAELPYGVNHQGSVSAVLQCLRDGSADFAVVRADDILERDEGLRVLGVFGSEPLPQYPDAPTLSELGLYPYWLGCASCVVAPAGVDPEAVAFYEQAFGEAMEDERYLSASSGITTDYRDAAETADLLLQQRRIARQVSSVLW